MTLRAIRALAIATLVAVPCLVSALPDEPETVLKSAIARFIDGDTDGALAAIKPLLVRRPVFRLAHLVHADMLSARAGRTLSLDRLDDADTGELARLWSEAEQRWNFVGPPSSERWPALLIDVPRSIGTLLLVDTSRSRLYRLQTQAGRLTLVEDFYTSIGRYGAGKTRAWDKRTPVGVYFIVDRMEDDELAERYGPMAFPVDYPNHWDRLNERTGDGIWLHGMERSMYSRPPRDSDGCVVLSNPDLATVAADIDIGETPLIVARDVAWSDSGDVDARKSIDGLLNRWRTSWESGDAASFVATYAPDFAPRGIERDDWVAGRQRALNARSVERVTIDERLIVAYPDESDLFVARFRLTLASGGRTITTLKRLYIRRFDDGELRIVAAGNG